MNEEPILMNDLTTFKEKPKVRTAKQIERHAREAERAAIVKWLRRNTDAPMGDAVRRKEAEAIEAGAHLNEGDK